jgi:predicted metalloprotease
VYNNSNSNNNNNNNKLTIYGQHHQKADVDRLHVSRKQGGRGLMQLEAAHAVKITKFVEYVDRKEDPLIQVVRTHRHNIDSAVLQTARRLKTNVQRETRKMKDSITEKTKEIWSGILFPSKTQYRQ